MISSIKLYIDMIITRSEEAAVTVSWQLLLIFEHTPRKHLISMTRQLMVFITTSTIIIITRFPFNPHPSHWTLMIKTLIITIIILFCEYLPACNWRPLAHHWSHRTHSWTPFDCDHMVSTAVDWVAQTKDGRADQDLVLRLDYYLYYYRYLYYCSPLLISMICLAVLCFVRCPRPGRHWCRVHIIPGAALQMTIASFDYYLDLDFVLDYSALPRITTKVFFSSSSSSCLSRPVCHHVPHYHHHFSRDTGSSSNQRSHCPGRTHRHLLVSCLGTDFYLYASRDFINNRCISANICTVHGHNGDWLMAYLSVVRWI